MNTCVLIETYDDALRGDFDLRDCAFSAYELVCCLGIDVAEFDHALDKHLYPRDLLREGLRNATVLKQHHAPRFHDSGQLCSNRYSKECLYTISITLLLLTPKVKLTLRVLRRKVTHYIVKRGRLRDKM